MSYSSNYKGLWLYYKIKAFNISVLKSLETDDLVFKHMKPITPY